jgi:hypothetical protein
MFNDGAPPPVSSHSVNRSNSFFSSQILILNNERKEKEKHSIEVHTSIISLVVRRNSRAHRQEEYWFKQKSQRDRENGTEWKEMTNPRVHILADQDQLTGHSQGRYSIDKDIDSD